MQKIILIGRGQIGSRLRKELEEAYSILQWDKDIDDLSIEDLRAIAPDAVINAAARTDLAWCEANAREAIRTNLEAPVRLYHRLLEYQQESESSVRFLHFSSGCVWDGPYRTDGKPFTPADPPTPAALYTWTKAAADAMLLERDPMNVAILRPRQIYSAEPTPRNTIVKLLQYPKLIDTPNSMTSLRTIVRSVKYLLEARSDWSGIWNLYDRGVTTPYEVGVMLSEYGLRPMPVRITKADLDTWHFPKRVDAVLYDERFEKRIQPEELADVLNATIRQYRANVVSLKVVE